MTTSKKPSRKNKANSALGEQPFSLMFDGHSAIILLIEPQTGIILDANQSALDFYGYPKSKLCGMTINEINILPPELVAAEFQRALDEGRNHFIFTHKLAGGEERTVEESLSPITLQGKQALLSIIHDVTEHRQAEKSRNVEQYFMDALLDNVPAYIYFKDRKSRFIRINNAHAKSLGLSDAGQVVGKTDFDFFTEEHAKHAYEDEQLIVETGQLISKEEKETRHNLPDSWVSTTKLPLRDNDNNIIGTLGISVDITERKRAEKRLEEKLTVERNLLSALLDNLPDVIYVKDMQGRKILSNIADWQRSGGKTIEDVLGKSDFDTYPPELAARYWADDKSVIDTGVPIINQEEPGLDPQGNPRWMLTTKVPLRDVNEQITGLIGIGRDITERKQAEETLSELKLLFHLLIESLHQNIYAKDVEGRFIFANQRYCETQGKPLEEILGKTDFDLHPPELAEKYRRDDRQVIEMGKTIELEEEHQPIGKDKFFVQVIKTPFYYAKGQPAGVLGIFWDITERKQSEAELRLAQAALEAAHRELQQSFIREQQLAHIDELTGINNHRSLLKLVEHEFNIALRYRSPLSMMFFDVDYFKQINDTFGHVLGDEALKKVVQVVCAELRSADEIGRYGGDEFVVLLPQTGAQEALRLAERIHASIAVMSMDTENGRLTLTISIGVAQTMHDAAYPDSVQNLLLRADRALYAAKQNGRNCTVIFDQM